MSNFSDGFMVKSYGEESWEVVEAFDYQCDKTGILATVPVGFVTNFTSVPGILRLFIEQRGVNSKPSMLHDYMYDRAAKVTKHGKPVTLTRKECDDVFRDSLLAVGVGRFKAWAMHKGVRLFGAKFFKPKDMYLGKKV